MHDDARSFEMKKYFALLALLMLSFVMLSGCASQKSADLPTRQSKIPASAVKQSPATDAYLPQLHSSEWQEPVLLSGPVNTAGAEDSAFVLPDGSALYFFFTPDANIPPEKQLLDNVTGIYVSKKQGSAWAEPMRVVLQDNGKLALDGCEFVQGNAMWFCSAREGYAGVNLFTAEYKSGKWQNWKYVGDKLMKDYKVGEMHIGADGNELYFHSPRQGGKGQFDIWVSEKANGEWQEPVNVGAVNSAENDGWPFVSQDGSELWLTRTYMGSPGIFRSKKVNGAWQEPELIVSQFAGEPTLDNAGNLYFTHHYVQDGKIIEADIYFARKK